MIVPTKSGAAAKSSTATARVCIERTRGGWVHRGIALAQFVERIVTIAFQGQGARATHARSGGPRRKKPRVVATLEASVDRRAVVSGPPKLNVECYKGFRLSAHICVVGRGGGTGRRASTGRCARSIASAYASNSPAASSPGTPLASARACDAFCAADWDSPAHDRNGVRRYPPPTDAALRTIGSCDAVTIVWAWVAWPSSSSRRTRYSDMWLPVTARLASSHLFASR